MKSTKNFECDFFFIRHGESESNVLGVINSLLETKNGLTEQGKEQVKNALEEGKPVRALNLDKHQLGFIYDFHLITAKKVMYVANVDDSDIENPDANPFVQKLKEHAKSENAPVVVICGKIESEIAELDKDDQTEMLESMGLTEPAVGPLARALNTLLGLISLCIIGGVCSSCAGNLYALAHLGALEISPKICWS